MKHVHAISALPKPAQGSTSAVESLILVFISIFFNDWDNFQSVLQNLSKFYSKTPN